MAEPKCVGGYWGFLGVWYLLLLMFLLGFGGLFVLFCMVDCLYIQSLDMDF